MGMGSAKPNETDARRLATLSLAAIGVVHGDFFQIPAGRVVGLGTQVQL